MCEIFLTERSIYKYVNTLKIIITKWKPCTHHPGDEIGHYQPFFPEVPCVSLPDRVPSPPRRDNLYLDVCVNLHLCENSFKSHWVLTKFSLDHKTCTGPTHTSKILLLSQPPSRLPKLFSTWKVVLLQMHRFQRQLTEDEAAWHHCIWTHWQIAYTSTLTA